MLAEKEYKEEACNKIYLALEGFSYEQAKQLLESIIAHQLPMKCVFTSSHEYPWRLKPSIESEFGVLPQKEVGQITRQAVGLNSPLLRQMDVTKETLAMISDSSQSQI